MVPHRNYMTAYLQSLLTILKSKCRHCLNAIFAFTESGAGSPSGLDLSRHMHMHRFMGMPVVSSCLIVEMCSIVCQLLRLKTQPSEAPSLHAPELSHVPALKYTGEKGGQLPLLCISSRNDRCKVTLRHSLSHALVVDLQVRTKVGTSAFPCITCGLEGEKGDGHDQRQL